MAIAGGDVTTQTLVFDHRKTMRDRQWQFEMIGIVQTHNSERTRVLQISGRKTIVNDPAQNPYASTTNTKGLGNGRSGPPTIAGASRIGMIITFALISGAITISGVLLVLMQGDMPEDKSPLRVDAESMPFLAVGLGACAMCVVGAWLSAKMLREKAAELLRSSDEPLPQPLDVSSNLPASASNYLLASSSATLVGQALMEGQAVINLILAFLSHNYVFLIPVLIGIVGIALQTPTPNKLKNTLEGLAMRR